MDNSSNNFIESIFIDNLKKELIKICTSHHLLNKQLYDIDELMSMWHDAAPSYMVNAIPDIPHYPMVSIAWAAYFGMGAAVYWNSDWEKVKDTDLFSFIRDKRGWDNMDDYVTAELVGLNAESKNAKEAAEAANLTTTIQECTDFALTMIRRQGIEPASREAFFMYAKVAKLFFLLGVSLQLFRMGYKYEKVTLN